MAGAEELAALPSLGPESARMLVEAGVEDVEALMRLGPEAAYHRLRFAFGRRATTNFLYALDNAVTGTRWRDMSRARKAELREAAKRIQAAVDAMGR
ncbi:hypothetical protein GC169_08615 [bacterium]|nr:hypothetical protein [bacterium]